MPAFAVAEEPKSAASKAAAPEPATVDPEVRNAQALLARAYARYGVSGIHRLLPKEAVRDMSAKGRRRAKRHRRHRRRHRRWELPDVSSPETLLFLLLAAFMLLVMWDSLKGGGGGTDALGPSLTSLQMSPFPLGTSAI